MTRVKLNLASGSVQEREVVTAFNFNNIKYVIFDGESTGSMGLPIVLVSKESNNKIVGITDAEEWKDTKENLKKIISGEKVEFARVNSEINADDVYYRQLTLPIASFDILKTSYEVPAEETPNEVSADQTPIFEQITPEDITGGTVPNIEPVAPSTFSETAEIVPGVSESNDTFNPFTSDVAIVQPSQVSTPEISAVTTDASSGPQTNQYDELKKEFLSKAEELFDSIYNKLNHED
ncbi:MAG: hypothetical protein IKX00_04540 [Bacilli bacterium]|nr:hypothetical protein [Bacilli bacterium]